MSFKISNVGAGESVAMTPWNVAWPGQMGNCSVLQAGFAVVLFLHSRGSWYIWFKTNYKTMDITAETCLTHF